MNKLQELYDGSTSAADYAAGYIAHMAKVVSSLDPEAVAAIGGIIDDVAAQDKTLFLIANGGSAAVSTHWVNDLSANTVVDGKPGYRVISLTDNASSITALGNDASFDEIFTIQLKANMRPGDVVLAMSVSGSSPNLVSAIDYGNANGATTIACVGCDGGKLKTLAKHVIHIESTRDEYGPIEDMFIVIMHIIQSYISMNRGRYLAH
ncbi:MAG: SIS domain-containing protein [Candidatus Hydrogenedentota bacterium]